MNEVFRYGKIIYERPNEKYVNKMLDMMNNKKITSMISTKKTVYTKKMELDWIKNHQNDNNFSVFDSNTLEYIGNCSINNISNNKGEIGIIICENMQGKHYAKEIIKGLIKYSFEVLNLDEVYAIVFSDNIKSLNCMLELGFKEYKRIDNVLKRNNIQVDDIYLSYKK